MVNDSIDDCYLRLFINSYVGDSLAFDVDFLRLGIVGVSACVLSAVHGVGACVVLVEGDGELAWGDADFLIVGSQFVLCDVVDDAAAQLCKCVFAFELDGRLGINPCAIDAADAVAGTESVGEDSDDAADG